MAKKPPKPAQTPSPPDATPEGAHVPTARLEPLAGLKPHPRNYRKHPEDQLAHIIESIRANGMYRNIVAARDGTILAGHGVVQACQKLGVTEVPVIRLDLDPEDPKALKLIAGDNEISHLGEIDDRALTELLKTIKENDEGGLLGTGYDDNMLASLVFVTRPASEVDTIDEAAEWVGMPEYGDGTLVTKMIVLFPSDAERERFCTEFAIEVREKGKRYWSTQWPSIARNDLASLRVTARKGAPQ